LIRSVAFASCGLLALVTVSSAQSPPNAITLIEPSGLSGWTAAQTSPPCVGNQSGTMTVGECAGWLRTDHTIFGDYTLAFEVRADRVGVEAFLGVLGVDGPYRRPELVVAVPILGPAAAPRHSSMIVEPIVVSAAARTRAMNATGEWNSYTVSRNRTGVHVLLNGIEIASPGPIRASDGWVGFRTDTGQFELRNLQLRHVFATEGRATRGKPGELIDGAYRPGNGVTLPKLLREVKPQYTRDAMDHRLEGVVLLECLVATDGHVAETTVIRSLDPDYGLDAKAIEAARQWRFQPGTRDGAPVPIWITIQLTFTLKK